mgnify:CR=1 FL=1
MDERSGTGGGNVTTHGWGRSGSGGSGRRGPHLGLEAERACAVCRSTFRPSRPAHITCSSTCRASYDLDALAGDAGVAAPADRDPWKLPAPARRVPPVGRLFDVRVLGGDAGLYTLANATLMHGVLTALADPADGREVRFSAWPERGCWAMLLDPSCEREGFGGRTHRARVGRTWRDVVVSEGWTVDPPVPRAPGRHRVEVETASAVVIRAGAEGRAHGEADERRTRTAPDAASLSSALATTLLARLGWPPRSAGVVPVTVVSADTRPAAVPLREVGYGGAGKVPKIGGDGFMRGWEGSLVVETSAMGAWLFELAKCVGLGGRVAYGFGRVDVRVGAPTG